MKFMRCFCGTFVTAEFSLEVQFTGKMVKCKAYTPVYSVIENCIVLEIHYAYTYFIKVTAMNECT